MRGGPRENPQSPAADRITSPGVSPADWLGRNAEKRFVELLCFGPCENRVPSQPTQMSSRLFSCRSRNLQGFISRSIGQTVRRLLPGLVFPLDIYSHMPIYGCANVMYLNLSPEHLSRLRFALGMAQMFGAVFSLTLIVETGVNAWSLASIIGTGLLTGASRLIFRRQSSAHGEER